MRPRKPVRGDYGPYTVLDLHELPDDGKGVELEDGWLIEVAAGSRHNWAIQNLGLILRNAAADVKAPVVVCFGGEWEISTPSGVRKPDVFVIPRETARAAIMDESPRLIPGARLLLAVEVVSPGSGSERTDRVRKVLEYAKLRIPQYWIVEHTPQASVQPLALGTDGYVPVPPVRQGVRFVAEIDPDNPFTVSFDPAELLDL
jgi:Uma2 family endonuclease